MITVVIRAMWDAARLLIIAVVAGCSLAAWSLLALAIITGGLHA